MNNCIYSTYEKKRIKTIKDPNDCLISNDDVTMISRYISDNKNKKFKILRKMDVLVGIDLLMNNNIDFENIFNSAILLIGGMPKYYCNEIKIVKRHNILQYNLIWQQPYNSLTSNRVPFACLTSNRVPFACLK